MCGQNCVTRPFYCSPKIFRVLYCLIIKEKSYCRGVPPFFSRFNNEVKANFLSITAYLWFCTSSLRWPIVLLVVAASANASLSSVIVCVHTSIYLQITALTTSCRLRSQAQRRCRLHS